MAEQRERPIFGVTRPPDEVAREEAREREIRERYTQGSWHSCVDWSKGYPVLCFWQVPREGEGG